MLYITSRQVRVFPLEYPITLTTNICIIASATQHQRLDKHHPNSNTTTTTIKMIANFKTLAVLAAVFSLASAAPTAPTAPTACDADTKAPSKTYTQPRVTHSVVAGRGGLKFDPDNIVAEIGEVVEFHFTPRNHSVVESSFGNPCQPKDATSFFSGFFPVAEGQSPEVFQIVVKDKNPIWFYCAQNTGNHCQAGMTGVVNQRFDSQFTLARHRELAAAVKVPSGVQNGIQGGARIPNPNPLSGF